MTCRIAFRGGRKGLVVRNTSDAFAPLDAAAPDRSRPADAVFDIAEVAEGGRRAAERSC